MSECIYCGGEIGQTCFDPQGHQQAAFERDNPEQLSPMDKLREMEAGFVVVFERDEIRILKLLDRGDTIRTKPFRANGADTKGGELWEAWYEWQTIHADEIQQLTSGHPCKVCSGKGKNKMGMACRDCNGIGFLL